MDKKKINIGFDIGVSSVGWSIIDEDYNIVDMGVRLFEDAANEKDGKLANEKRRSARGARRRLRRQANRKHDLLNLFVNEGLVDSYEQAYEKINYDINDFDVENPIELKVKAINQKISNDELITILFHYVHHRGYFYITEEDLNDKQADVNDDRFPSVKILEFYKSNGYYKNSKISKSIKNSDYVKEIKVILQKQNKSQDFIDKYIKIFTNVRDFAQGPGNEKTPTKYGLYQEQWDSEAKALVIKKIGDNLWESKVGKCSYYPDEYRGGKNSPIAELFNLLNDLNNLIFFENRDNKLSKEHKQVIFEMINTSILTKAKNKKIKLSDVAKVYGDSIEEWQISGFRHDKSNKPLITELTNLAAIAIFLNSNNVLNSNNIFDSKTMNQINDLFISICNIQDIEKRISIISQTYPSIDKQSVSELVCTKLKSLSQTHSLSYRAMKDYIDYGLKESFNQMVYFSENRQTKIGDQPITKYLKTGMFDNEVISPTVRRAFNQSIAVMNKIIKLYGNYEINNVSIELARDKNTAEQRKSITESQKNKEQENKEILSLIGTNSLNGINGKDRLKIQLLREQGMIDIYDGEPIDPLEVIGSDKYDVDHIIPYSISAVDARYNKVLTKKHNNSLKGNKTPYQWLSPNGQFEQFESRVNQHIINAKKKKWLLYMSDPSENLIDFIERNLVDTRYASKLFMNTLNQFFQNSKNIYPNAKVRVLNGSVTNYCRYNLFSVKGSNVFQKQREFYYHHAVDATFVNYLGMHPNISKLVSLQASLNKFTKDNQDDKQIRVVDKNTGEITNLSETFRTNDNVKRISTQLLDYVTNQKVKFSRQLMTKNNVQLSNETIYSFKFNEDKQSGNIINKLKLLDSKTKIDDLAKFFMDEEIQKDEKCSLSNTLLVYREDKVLYDKLKTIFNQYYNNKINPFIAYMKDQYKIDNPQFMNIDNQRVNSLRIIGKNKTINNIIVLKKHIKNANTKKQNKYAIMESLNALEILLFRNNKNKLIVIPINQVVLNYHKNKQVIDEKKLTLILINKNINSDSYKCGKYIRITNGFIFAKKETDLLFFSNGGGDFSQNKIELKALFCNNAEHFERDQMQISISTIVNEYDICQVDVLGNIYNRKNIDDVI